MGESGTAILVINAGSSSVKFALIGAESGRAFRRGQIEGLGGTPRFQAEDGRPTPALASSCSHDDAVSAILGWIEADAPEITPIAAGHRVVHGGTRFVAPRLVDGDTLVGITALEPLAPLHQPHNAAAIRALARRRPDLPQVACFDTAFHATQPIEARRLPLPRAFAERGLVRYGFHGLSYESIVAQWPRVTRSPLPRRLVVAHLGNGCSLCAIADGRSVATTMGFSTLDGVPMGTRPGALDPGVLLHLIRAEGMECRDLEDLLYRRSGLLGVSGISGDMRALLASGEPAAAETIDWFCYCVAREIASLAGALSGLDALVFTGGIGERAAPVRAKIVARCRWLGGDLDTAANGAHGPRISTAGARAPVWVIPTDEEGVIARHTLSLVRPGLLPYP